MLQKFTASGDLLRQARGKAGFTQSKVAEKTGMHKQFVSNYERGLCLPPHDKMLDIMKLTKLNKKKMLETIVQDLVRESRAFYEESWKVRK